MPSFSHFFKHSKNINLITDMDTNLIRHNQEATAIFGLKENPSEQISIFDITHDNDKAALKSKLKTLKENLDQPEKLILQCTHHSQKVLNISWEILCDGKFFYFIGRDHVTDSFSNAYFKEIQDASDIGYWRLDIDNNQVLWSDKTYFIHEMEPGTKIETSDAINFYSPEARDEIQNCVAQGIENGVPWDIELPLLTAKQNKIWVKATGKPIIREGRVKELYGTFQDIDERKNSELRLKYLIDNAGDGFWDWYIKEDYEYMSPRFWEILGFKPEEKKHHPSEWQKLIFKEDLEVALSNFEKHVKTKGEYPFRQEVRYHHKDGSTVWVACNGAVVQWDENNQPIRVVGTHTDITKLKEAQTKITETYKLASLGTMAGGIAHEINNPLAIISTNTMLLKTVLKSHSYTDKKEIYDLSIKNIESTVERISKIIQGMMQLIHNNKNKQFEIKDFKDLIETVCAFSIEKLRAECIDFKVKIENSGNVNCNLTQISQVITNILSNAIHAVSEMENKWISIQAYTESEKAILKIYDSGDGVPDKILNKIFEPFYSSKKIGEGTGLGLSISKEIMRQHGGSITYSKKGGSSCFTLELPLLLVEDTENHD